MQGVDKWFLGIVVVLAVIGIFIFFSASLGLLAREGGRFSGVLVSQSSGLVLGALLFFFGLRLRYTLLHRYAFYLFLVALLFTAAVFIPGVGVAHGGATRWIFIGAFSVQPAEFLKLGFVFYFAAWLSAVKTQVRSLVFGLLPLVIIVGLVGLILLKQPDTGTYAVILASALGMFIAGGAPWKYTLTMGVSAFAGITLLAATRPYVQERILVFLNPALDPQGAGYQIKQSLLAIGSGEFFGRGFGQSIQKFNFLPEPTGDSIFAVFAEEFGFVGALLLITLFLCLAFRGLSLVSRAPDYFSRLTVVGIVILVVSQAFLNIGSMLGVFPLTGLPLPFVSHGGTALMMTLFSMGLLLNMTREKT